MQAVVAAYDDQYEQNFDSTQIWHGHKLPDNFLEGVPLRVTAGKPAHYVPNVLSWPIVSPKMLTCFQKFQTQMQILDARFLDESGRQALSGYKVLNILKCLRGAVDLEKSTTSPSEIPPGIN